MAIYNLGQLQELQEQVNPYMDTLMKFGMQSELTQQEIAGKKEIATATGEAEAKAVLAKSEIERSDQTRKYLMGAWQNFYDKPEDQRSMFLTSDGGKELLKLTKKYLPEMIDEQGNPVTLPSTKDTVKQQLDSQISAVKNKLLVNGPRSLTEGETSILQMEGFKDEISQVTADLYRNPEFLFMLEENPEKAKEMAQSALRIRLEMRNKGSRGVNSFSSELSSGRQPLFYGSRAAFPGVGKAPIAEEATPQKTRFKVRRLP